MKYTSIVEYHEELRREHKIPNDFPDVKAWFDIFGLKYIPLYEANNSKEKDSSEDQ